MLGTVPRASLNYKNMLGTTIQKAGSVLGTWTGSSEPELGTVDKEGKCA